MATNTGIPIEHTVGMPYTNIYTTTNLMYPIDLNESDSADHTRGNQYGNNCVVFHINIQNDSKFTNGATTDSGGINTNSGPISAGDVELALGVLGGLKAVSDAFSGWRQPQYSGAWVTDPTGARAWVIDPIAARAAERVAFFSNVRTILMAAGNVTPLPLAFAAGGVVGEYSKPVKRLDTTIMMHMPPNLQISYSTNYEEENMPVPYRAVAANDVRHSIANFALSALPGLSKLAKVAPNPSKEQVFKDVDTRSFSFNFLFAPTNETEAQNVLNIIQKFKFHMHPEFKDDTNFLYIYPSEFDISYLHNGIENTNLHGHTSAVLVAMNLDYAPANTGFTSFANGMPTQIAMSLQFKELAKLTKELIDKGNF